jgi:HJR/Mrr/RecB family endonuclease
MSKSEDLFERAIQGLVTRVSGRVVAAIVLLLYPGLGLVLPAALHWSVSSLVDANIVGALFAGIVSLGWLLVHIEARDRRHLVEWTTNLRLLNAQEFEWLVGELFRREGWGVRETGQHDGSDGNIDLELTQDGQRMIVQCKRWTSKRVGVDEVRGFAGTLMREGLSGSAGVFVTLSDFTEQARAEAQTTGIALVDRRGLFSRLESARRTEACPTCQSLMVLDRSSRGWWMRCVASGCHGKRDLGSDPGRAVELLM